MNKLIILLSLVCILCGCRQNKSSIKDIEADSVQVSKFLALSFDDGPNQTTTEILNVLEKYGVKGSFFVIGQNINDSTAPIMRRALNMGCDVQNHSYSHVAMNKLTVEEIKLEISKTSALINQYAGVVPSFFRPPFIANNQLMFDNIDLTFICGIGVEDWVPSVSAEERAKRIMESATDGVIFLLHDILGNDATVQALDMVIPKLKEQGYQFVTVPELFKVKNITPMRNKLYSNVLTD